MIKKKKIDFAFVVLTYRNTCDVIELVESIKEKYRKYSYKVLIVNSFYDNKTKEILENVAKEKECIFLNVENKGYGYGNNKGVEYFNNNYDYDFLVVSNPDTVIVKNDFEYGTISEEKALISPCIKNLNGKRQNPYWVIKNDLSEYLVYKGYKKQNKIYIYVGIGINKVIRIFFNIKKDRSKSRVFASHGSYLIFTRKAIESIGVLFDEEMFLFAEENLLAHILKQNNIPVYYTSRVEILHKEDGSMKLANVNENSELRKSIIYYYEKIRGMKR